MSGKKCSPVGKSVHKKYNNRQILTVLKFISEGVGFCPLAFLLVHPPPGRGREAGGGEGEEGLEAGQQHQHQGEGGLAAGQKI